MTPLEVAKALAEAIYETVEAGDYTGYQWRRCRLCGCDEGHEDTCPAPQMPAIVAALERLEKLDAYAEATRKMVMPLTKSFIDMGLVAPD